MENVDLNALTTDEYDSSSSLEEYNISSNDRYGIEEEDEAMDDLEYGMDVSGMVNDFRSWGSDVGSILLEKIMQNNTPIEINVEDVLGNEFNTVEEAELFYRKYALFVGFSVHRDNIVVDKESEVVIRRRWVCNQAGVRPPKYLQLQNRKRKAKPITRVKCRASLAIKLNNEIGKYVIHCFVPGHNHDLVSPYQLQFIRGNRKVTDSALATALALRHIGIRTCQVMDLLVSQCGGFKYVGFTQKDLYNAFNKVIDNKMETSDAETTLAYLRAKGEMDNGLFVRYSLDAKDHLLNLFWSDSHSRYDYSHFGDVVGFDATYNKNKYNKLVITLIGTNNHWQTIVFGVTLLANETFETYCWLMESLLLAMDVKVPLTIITDGDKAIRAAVRYIFPQCQHRLCAWHLMRNAETVVKNPNFL